MKLFNADALRQAMGTVDPSFTEDLVAKTLVQHGLMPGGGTFTGSSPMSGLQGAFADVKAHPKTLDCPEGASFSAQTFQCAAGSREYLIYVPSSAGDKPSGIVLMLHGCTQTHQDFAIGTKMNALAEKGGFIVLYPQQARGENAQSCWNWFRRGDQMRDRGEPAILAGLTREVMQRYAVPKDKTFVAGLSAGAAMAMILGTTYPDVFAAVGAHSGLPYGAAKDVPSAFAAMGGNSLSAPAPVTGRLPRVIVFHGADDKTVHPMNAEQIKQQVQAASPYQTLVDEEKAEASGRSYTRQLTKSVEGRTLFEQWTVDGLGHAWSGGDRRGSYSDAAGPDASAEMVRFFFENSHG